MLSLDSSRKAFAVLCLPTEVFYFLDTLCFLDDSKLDFNTTEIILNCLTILNYCVLEPVTSIKLLHEKYTDILINIIKIKKEFSISAIKVIESFTSIRFEG